MAAVSFSQATYSIGENAQTLTVSVVRSGDTELYGVVLVANHPYEGTATGKFCTSFTAWASESEPT